MQAIKIILFK